jgi:hypothetical protein
MPSKKQVLVGEETFFVVTRSLDKTVTVTFYVRKCDSHLLLFSADDP